MVAARIVLGDAGLDLAHHVAAHVGALGEDAAAETREDGDQRGAEAKRHERPDHLVVGRLHPQHPRQNRVVAGHAQQRAAGHEHAGDRARAERHRQALVQALGGGLRRAHVGPHRDQHAGIAGRAREHGADQEAQGGELPDEEEQQTEDDHAHQGDGRVLATKIGGSAFLDGGGDLAHALVACVRLHQRSRLQHAVEDPDHAGQKDPPKIGIGRQSSPYMFVVSGSSTFCTKARRQTRRFAPLRISDYER
jgi:hypothetical protein